MASVNERTPLVSKDESVKVKYSAATFRWLMFSVFTTAVAFSHTATSQMYSFRVFACEEYYKVNPPYEGSGDQCTLPWVDSTSSKMISTMITVSMVTGVANLISVSVLLKKFGVKFTIMQQTLWPILRVAIQLSGLHYGGYRGALLMQLSQLATIVGGPGGYVLCANAFCAEIVEKEEQTASFGILQGNTMVGMSISLLLGGMLGDAMGLMAPFKVAMVLFAITGIVMQLVLPKIPIPPPKDNKSSSGVFAFLDPLKVFGPRKVVDPKSGKEVTYLGMLFLGLGAFTAVLATFYVPLMLQLVATQLYEFHPTENGYLMSSTALSRAFFLTVLFPRIISKGRKWFSSSSSPLSPSLEAANPVESIPTTAESFEPPIPASELGATEEPPKTPSPTDVAHGSKFDLAFLRWSVVVDALLTACVAFSNRGWHMYLAAAVLPFASGTAPAAKGVIMEMVPAEDRSDALSGIALVETLAGIVTVSAFGELFAYLASVGHTNLVFFFNAGTALLAAFLLLLVRFPPSVVSSSS